MRNALLIFLLLFTFTALKAQNITVSGQVTDTEGEVLVGIAIAVKGTHKGTFTDGNGKYMMQSLSATDVLEFTFLGMKTEARTVGRNTTINVVMQSNENIMDEVVVVGYGTVRKSDLTGSVSVVKMDDVAALPTMSALDAMQGKVAGVNIISNTGEPGSGMTFQVRGATSITGSNQPLIVLDGQPLNTDFGSVSANAGIEPTAQRPSTDPMANINPNDIESIQILKDASSTAIYGSAGANGVVLITTKSGKEGKDVIKYNGRIDIAYLPKKLKVASTAEYFNFIYEAQLNDKIANPRFASPEAAAEAAALLPNTNWQDETYETSVSHDHQISFSGGDKKMRYLISANFTDQQAIVKNGYFKRGGLRANLSRKLSSKLNLSSRIYLARNEKSQIPQSNSQGNISTSVVLSALAFKPEDVAYNDDGEIDGELTNNPVVMRETIQDKTETNTILANLKLEYDILKGLKFSINGNVNSINTVKQFYWPRTLWQGKSNNGSGRRADNNNLTYVLEYLLSFNRRFGKHNINAVGGYSWQEWRNTFSGMLSTGTPSDALGYNYFAWAQYPGKMQNGNTIRKMSSYLGRANYSFDDRYAVTFTGRADGSSRLAPGHKWGFFPSVGLAWNVDNEEFFKPVSSVVSNLKLRTSYGTSGNENIAIGATQSKIVYNDVVFGKNSVMPGFIVGNFAQPNLKWETTKQINVGLDIGLLKRRLDLTIDVYQKNTTDLLLNVTLPGSSTFGSYSNNAGEVRNRGVDIEVTGRILQGKVNLNVSGNISFLKNKIMSMGADGIIYGQNYCDNGQYTLNQPIHIARAGQPVGMFLGYKTEGIYQTQEEIDNHIVNGRVVNPTAKPGDIRWADFNGDGQITADDRTIIGTPYPDFTYGFNVDLSYKDFSLAMTILGSKGNQLINFNKWIMDGLSTKTNGNISKAAYDGRWTGPGTSNLYPRPHTNDVFNTRFPDWMVEGASYLRLQNVTVSYSIPKKLVRKAKLEKLRIYATGTNLFTITDYSGYDPAISAFGDRALQPGVDFGTLPAPRIISAGMEITF